MRNTKRIWQGAIGALLLNIPQVHGQSVQLDQSFGEAGVVLTGADSSSVEGHDIAVLPTGAMLVAGNYNSTEGTAEAILGLHLVKYNEDGSVDTSFGDQGYVISDFGREVVEEKDMEVQSDGRIRVVLVDYSNNLDARSFIAGYTPDGLLDSTYGEFGIVDLIVPTDSFALTTCSTLDQADHLYVAGTCGGRTKVFKLNPDGSPELAFGDEGVADVYGVSSYPYFFADDLLVDQAGRILVVGQRHSGSEINFAAGRLMADGAHDSTWGDAGMWWSNLSGFPSESECAESVALTDTGYLVGGYSDAADDDWRLTLVKFLDDGTLDADFGTGGVVRTHVGNYGAIARSLWIEPTGKIVVSAHGSATNSLRMVRYLSDGTLDQSFGSNGLLSTDLFMDRVQNWDVAKDNSNRILLVGTVDDGTIDDFYVALARYLNDFNLAIPGASDLFGPPTISPGLIRDFATLSYTLATSQQVTVRLYSADGRTVHTYFQGARQLAGMHRLELNFADVVPGSYVLSIGTPSGEAASVKLVRE